MKKIQQHKYASPQKKTLKESFMIYQIKILNR